jgi:mono/diheme cytochrome c family protein
MRHLARTLASTLLFSVFTLSCSHAQVPLPEITGAAPSDALSVARGEYIVRDVAACGGCHAADAKQPDGPLSGGKEFRDWRVGISRASNLTPDPETGLGKWSEAEIVRAIRNGQARNGRLLAPVMPYEWLHEMSDNDAVAVARYLKSLPPVHNDVKQSTNLIFKLGKLFLKPKPAVAIAAATPGPTAEYGSYLSQHVGLCAECHTPRGGLLSRADRNRLFAGVTHPPKDFPAPPANLTPDRASGIGKWSEADFVTTIRTGTDPDGDRLNPFMPWQENRRMTDDDLRAIYSYLRTLPPIASH